MTHSAFILSHHSLGLTLLPSRLFLCISGPTRGRCWVRNLPCRLRLYLRIGYRLFPLLQLVGLFRCRFDSIHVQACALAAVPPQWSQQMILPTYRDYLYTSLGVCGRWGIRTHAHPTVTCPLHLLRVFTFHVLSWIVVFSKNLRTSQRAGIEKIKLHFLIRMGMSSADDEKKIDFKFVWYMN